MRNLKLIGRSLLRFSSEEDPLPLAATAWDPATNSIVCAFGPSGSRAVIEVKRLLYEQSADEDRLDSIASWDAPCPLPELLHDSILDLHHFSDTSTTCLVLAGGDIVLVREDPLENEELVEIVGSIDVGISAAAWSPDEELLSITTNANTLLLFSRDIENIATVTLAAEDVNVSSHVSVGWGKKETQFKGKRAKALQDPTVPERVDEGVLAPHEDGQVKISWRGDGAYFAVNGVEQGQRRMIRVYSREGQLDSVSEPVDGLEGGLSWRPSGNLISGVRRQEDKIEVVFFERNGLRHGQFDLRLTPEELQALTTPLALQWNSDSSVLAVSYPDKVQLWTMSNYHYFLKQELKLAEISTGNVSVNWHAERPLYLALAISGSLQMLEYLSVPTIGNTAPPADLGLAAVIDGLTLKLTPLRIANVPPPMSLIQLALDSKAVDVAISATNKRLAVISNTDVAVYSLELDKRPVPAPKLIWRSDALKNHFPRQIAFVDDKQFYILSDSWEEEESSLWKSDENDELTYLGPILEPSRASSIVQRVDYGNLYVQFYDGVFYDISPDGPMAKVAKRTASLPKFPLFAADARTVVLDDKVTSIGLTRSGILYVNDRLLVRNCTSFVVTNAHLIFTTTQHLLKFVHLTSVEDLEVPLDEPQKDERCRSIERGARLITAMPTTYSVVLQMPRGNLETIYPRALVLAAIRRSIEADQYGEAFLACRNQRVDMNILHDHDPERFMKSIEKFLGQVKKVEHVDLFLSQLRNEDVSETMYKETLKKKDQLEKPVIPTSIIETKVNRVCDAFLAVLERPLYKESHLQNTITAHVSKDPPDLEAGLEMIGRLQASQDPLTEKAAEHICFLADVNKLYETALGIYNLELALLIAQQSQKDPREYLPHLQSLHDLPLLRRKFQIDDQLSRRTKALNHLKELSEFEELKGYVQKHLLFTEALALYQYDTPHLNQIMRLYADDLATSNRHKEAAVAYEYLSDYTSAYPHYFSANLWREALSSATLAGISTPELHSLATSLSEGLTESKDYLSASTIHLEYLSDLPTSTKLLCRGCHFSEAIRLSVLHRQPTLLESTIDPGLIERSAEMTEFLAEMKTQLQAQVPRLRELRQKKKDDPMAFFEGTFETAGGADIPDNISLAPTDTTSGGTFMTRYTNRTGTVNTTATRRTSKKKRQEERKRARGKKGTVYEEEYLVNSIERLIERLNSVNEEVERLVDGLVRRAMRERADAVTRAIQDVFGLCSEAVKELWEGKEEVDVGKGVVNGVGEDGALRPQGADATLWASMEEVNKKRDPPIIKAFERLSLLG